jgi:AcrR family transcriptional regulator
MGRRPRVTRDEVFRAAREAFAQRGYEGTTLAAIGARLDVSPAAILRHAPTKEALFRDAMAAGEAEEGLPSDFLAATPASENPARVLRRLALTFVPFIERKMGENIAHFLRARSEEEARTVRLPFDPRQKSSPPARVLAALEDYLRRARAAGTVRLRDPRAGALAFLGALQSYVFIHRVARISPAVPLLRYLDTLFDIWTGGALSSGRKTK